MFLKKIIQNKITFKSILLIQFFFLSTLSFAESTCQITTTAIQKASQIRGLKQKFKVPCELHNQDEVRKFIQGEVDKQTNTEKFTNEEYSLKFITFLPKDFDYRKTIVELYTTQIGGYYNPETKQYVMAAWLPEIMQEPIAVHELTHALQDQYYDLTKLTDTKKMTTDEALAVQALIEGDATVVMTDFSMRGLGKELKDTPNVESFMMQNVLGMGLTAGLANVPETIKFSMLFPYTSGMRFAHALLRKGDYKEIDKAFDVNALPRSTQEILHPEMYKGERAPKNYYDEAGSGGKKEYLYRDTMGEFIISSILSQANDPKLSSEIASGWVDDIVEKKKNDVGSDVWSWKTTWKDAKHAQMFYEAFKKCDLKQKHGTPSFTRHVGEPKGVEVVIEGL